MPNQTPRAKEFAPSNFDLYVVAISLVGVLLSAIPFVSEDFFQALFGSSSWTATGTAVGEVTVLENDIRVKGSAELVWQRARVPVGVYSGDSVFTGENSRSKINLTSGGSLDLEPNSLVTFMPINKTATIAKVAHGHVRLKPRGKVKLSLAGRLLEISGSDTEPEAEVEVIVHEHKPMKIMVTNGRVQIQAARKAENVGDETPQEPVTISAGQSLALEALAPTAGAVESTPMGAVAPIAAAEGDALVAPESTAAIIDEAPTPLVATDPDPAGELTRNVKSPSTAGLDPVFDFVRSLAEVKSQQCFTQPRTPSSIESTESLQIKIPSFESWDDTSGPFFFRRRQGFWAQAGSSVVTQQIDNPTMSAGFGNTQQLALRNGIGVWRGNYFVEGYWREPVMNTQGEVYHPRWVQGLLGVGTELPRFLNITPHLSLVGGWEIYKNAGSKDANLLTGYSAPTVGMRARFVIGRRWETGGDLQLSYLQAPQRIQKVFVQGDLRYWLSPSIAIGAGYWIDTTDVRSIDGYSFREQSYAAETFIKWAP